MPWNEEQQRQARLMSSGSWPKREARKTTFRDVLRALGIASSPLDLTSQEPEGVRPDYGLTGAGLERRRRYPGEYFPGEATQADVAGALWNIVESAGVENLPGIGPHKTAKQAPGRVRPGHETEFAKWFGKSKAVDAGGQPLTLYKAMYPYDWTKTSEPDSPPSEQLNVINRTTEFPAFNHGEPGVRLAGFFGDKETANHFTSGSSSSAVYPVHLSFQKPHIIDARGKNAGDIQFGGSGKAFRDAIRSGKFDSVIIRNTADEGDVYIALKPHQIKSATGNRGTYSRDSADIRE